MRELVYINFEFSFGRMISAVVANLDQNIYRTGFNHGDYSWRFINYFLAVGEASRTPPYTKHCPIPDHVLAEDELCAEIYKHNGYQNVEVLKKVYRLSYLDGIEPTCQEEYALIATGLHDGDLLVKTLLPLIKKQNAITFYLKPHPRSDKRYLDAIPDISNLVIVEKPIENQQEKNKNLNTNKINVANNPDCLLLAKKNQKISRNERCPVTEKKFKHCCGAL